MSRAEQSTSLERTYRYLRIGIAGTTVVILVSVLVAVPGTGWLTSLSAYYYTPARDALSGALIAASLGLLALSGRGVERALLDAAALFAPLIALVPTTLVPGAVPGVEVPCDDRCFPPAYEAATANGVLTYLIVGATAVGVALFVATFRQTALGDVWFSLALAVVVLGTTATVWMLARDVFLAQAHFVATIAFFALFAAVAIRAAFPRRTDPPPPVYRVLYTAIAVLLVGVLVAYAALAPFGEEAGVPLTLFAEAAALLLFTAFWIVQCVEKWHDADPALH